MKKSVWLTMVSLFLSVGMMLRADRILYIGDSITDGGWGNSGGSAKPSDQRNHWDWNHIYGHSYMMLCAARCQSECPEQGLEFFNRGISGNTLADLQRRWQADCLALHPDVVSILIGTNDVNEYLTIRAKESAGAEQRTREFSVDDWTERYRRLLQHTRDSLPNVRLVLCTPFVAKVGKVGAAADYAERDSLVRAEALAVEKLSKEFDAVLVPFDQLFHQLCSQYTPSYWIWDGIHPAPAGHQRMADLWLEKVQIQGVNSSKRN